MEETGWVVEVVAGPGAPRRLELGPGRRLEVGREEGADLRIDVAQVSGRHLALEVVAGGLELTDLESRHGVLVDGARLEAVRRLEAPARVQVGPTMLSVRAAGGAVGGDVRAALLESLTRLLVPEDEDQAGLLEAALDALTRALDADRALLFQGSGAAPVAAVGAPGGVSRTVLRRAAAEAEPLLLTTLEVEDLRGEVASVQGDLRSIMAAGLAGQPGGVLYLDSSLARRRFDERDRRMLAAFARALGGALEAAADRGRGARLAELHQRGLDGVRLTGSSPAMEDVRRELAKAAPADISVLITGESGTGKEVAARALHQGSARRSGPFVAVNCAALPAELVEAELFGAVAGAFTDGKVARRGRFELAEGGTLFLDEVGDLPLEAQAKVLRALQEREVQPLGAARPRPVDFRLVCATNVDLEAAVAEGRFREDLYFRVAVFRVQLPPLRARGEDVLELAEGFLSEVGRDLRKPLEGFAPGARAWLLAYPWPGNVRELRNVVERAAVREEGARVGEAALRPALPVPGAGEAGAGAVADLSQFPEDLAEARRSFDLAFFRHQLRRHQGNVAAMSRAIGMTRKNLYARCRDLGLEPGDFR